MIEICFTDFQKMEKAGAIASVSVYEDELEEAINYFNESLPMSKEKIDEWMDNIRLITDRLNEKISHAKSWFKHTLTSLRSLIDELDGMQELSGSECVSAHDWIEELSIVYGIIDYFNINGYHDVTEGKYSPKSFKNLLKTSELLENISEEPTRISKPKKEINNETAKTETFISLPLSDHSNNEFSYDEHRQCFIRKGKVRREYCFPGYSMHRGYIGQGRMLEILNDNGETTRIPHPKDALYREIKINR